MTCVRPVVVVLLALSACRPGVAPDRPDTAPGDSVPTEAVPEAAVPPEPPLCHVELTCGQEIPDEPKIPCTLLVAEADGTVLYDGRAGVEKRGRSSVYFVKPPYAVELWPEGATADGQGTVSADFFGMGGESDWILNGAYVDRSLMRNKLVYDLFQSMGGSDRYAAEQVFCDLTLDGAWKGIYLLGERVKRDDDRVAIAEEDSFILKNDDAGGGILAAGVVYAEWFLVHPTAEEIDAARLEAIRDYVGGWQEIVAASSQDAPDPAIFDRMDLDSAVDWVLLQEFAKNNDAYFLSVHLWKDAGGAMHLIPWDIDLSFGYPYYDCGWEGWIEGRTEFAWKLGQVPEFRERMVERWSDLREGVLATDAVLDRMTVYREVMGDTAYDNFEVWPIDEIQFCWGGTCWLCPVESYDAEVEGMRAWAEARLDWMDAHVQNWWTGHP